MTRRTLAQVAARAAAQVAAIAGLLAGCGGGGGSKPLTESDFCSQKADAECQVADRCVTDKLACKTERMNLCTAFVANAKASGKRKFVPGNVSACIGKTNAVYAKTSPITPKELADMDDVCNYVFQGTGEVAIDNCDVKYDCKGKVICDKTFCAMATNVTAGCGNPGDTCPTGKYCAPNSAGNLTCTDRGASGAACSDTKPCLESLHCAANGTCGDRVAQGGACVSSDDCATTAPYCDPYAGNKCDPGLSFSPGSMSCNDFGGAPGTPGTGGSNGGTGGSGGGGAGGGGGSGGSGGRGGSGGGTGGSGTGGSGTGGSGTGGSSGGAGGATGTGGAGGATGTGGTSN